MMFNKEKTVERTEEENINIRHLIDEAKKKPLADQLNHVLRRSHTPGIHDTALEESVAERDKRIKELEIELDDLMNEDDAHHDQITGLEKKVKEILDDLEECNCMGDVSKLLREYGR